MGKLWKLAFLAGIVLLGYYLITHLSWGSPDQAGSVTYRYGQVEFHEVLTPEEVRAVTKILNGKLKQDSDIFGIPSCGFQEDIAITLGDTAYALACDDCGTLWICGTQYYLNLSDAERETLEEIFTSRGGKFPCLHRDEQNTLQF